MKYYPQRLELLILVFGDYLFGKIVGVTLLFFINSYKIIVGKYSIPQKDIMMLVNEHALINMIERVTIYMVEL